MNLTHLLKRFKWVRFRICPYWFVHNEFGYLTSQHSHLLTRLTPFVKPWPQQNKNFRVSEVSPSHRMFQEDGAQSSNQLQVPLRFKTQRISWSCLQIPGKMGGGKTEDARWMESQDKKAYSPRAQVGIHKKNGWRVLSFRQGIAEGSKYVFWHLQFKNFQS